MKVIPFMADFCNTVNLKVIPSERGKILNCQVSEEVCGVAVLGETPKLSGYGPGQPAVGDPA